MDAVMVVVRTWVWGRVWCKDWVGGAGGGRRVWVGVVVRGEWVERRRRMRGTSRWCGEA